MTIEVIALLGTLMVLLLLRVPVAISLATSALVGVLMQGMSPLAVVQRLYAGTESWVLMAIPFFILSGAIMETGGLGRRLINFCNAVFGFMPGGLANVNIGASMIFGGTSGSAVADTSAVGTVLIPAMQREGYSAPFSAAVTAASSPIGMIIPPSIPMVVWSFISGQSLSVLFLGGVIPGIMVGIGLMIVSTVICIRRGYQASGDRFRFGALRETALDGVIALGAPAIIIGGIMTGIFTPTEAGVIAVAYALVAAGLIYREFKLADLWPVLVQAGKTSASVMFVVAGATAFSWVLAVNQVPQSLGRAIMSVADTPGQFVLIGAALLFVLGMFLDTTTIILLVGPVLAPLAVVAGVDPVQSTLIFLVVLATGLVTPPLGLCLFVASSISGVKVELIAREALPFVLTMLVIAFLLWLFPPLVTWLPGLIS